MPVSPKAPTFGAGAKTGKYERLFAAIDSDVRNGFDGIKVHYDIDADASEEDLKALIAQSQKRSAVFDIVTNPTNVTVDVN